MRGAPARALSWVAPERSGLPSSGRRRIRLIRSAWPSGGAAGGSLIGRRQHITRRLDAQRIDAAAVGTQDAELEAVDVRDLAATRQAAELLHQEPGDGVDTLSLGKVGAEELVELLDERDAAHGELRLGITAYVQIVLDIELIVDLADDLLDDVLYGAQARYATVLIDHDRHVIAVAAKFLQQHVQSLGFRHEYGRAHVLADVEALARLRGREAQQVLGEQDADDVVAIPVHDRKTRVSGLHHHRQDAGRRLVAAHEHHLGARHHDVADLQIAHLEYAFEHGERVAVDDRAVGCLAQHLGERLAVLRLGGEPVCQTPQPASRGVEILPHDPQLRYGLANPRRCSTATSRRSMRRASAARTWS